MERKDYADKFFTIKNDILKEIREILPSGKHEFKETFYAHFINGEVATTEEFLAVEVAKDCQMVSFYTCPCQIPSGAEIIDGEDVFFYDSETFLDILDNLKKEIRAGKIEHLLDIVKRNGGELIFDGNFKFDGVDQEFECENNSLNGIWIDPQGELRFDTSWEGGEYVNTVPYVEDDELDRIIAYVESQTQKKFTLRVSGSYSRTFEIEASSYEEAEKIAKEEWLINPLCYDDSDGEDWDGHEI